MAVEKMMLATLSGPQDMVDEAIAGFVLGQAFHPVNALETLGGKYRLLPFDVQSPFGELLQKARETMQRLGVEPAYAPFEDRNFTEQSAGEELERIRNGTEAVLSEKESLEHRAADDESVMEQLTHLIVVEEELNDLFAMKYVKFRFGRIPQDHFAECYNRAKAQDDVFYFPTGRDERQVYGMYFALPRSAEQVDSAFAALGFERIRILDQTKIQGTAEETTVQMKSEVAQLRGRIQELNAQLERIRAENTQSLCAVFSYLKFMTGCLELRAMAGYRHGRFYITGWIPQCTAAEYAAKFQAREGFSCLISSAEDSQYAGTPPTKIRGGLLNKVFRPLLCMYGLPAYHELDPSMFMALSFVLFFGIMFGDVGQGIGIAIIGFLLAKFKKMWLGRVIVCCGISATVFGFVYGSVFGFEDILPGFKILEGSNVTTLLILSLGLGVVILCLVMILNIINGVKQRDWGKVLFGPNSVTGVVFYLGLILAAIAKLALGVNLFTPVYVLLVLILPIVLMLFSEPLHKLLAGDPEWRHIKLGSLLGSGFFELFETLLSYLTNTLSFLRVGAYAITHVGLMLVVQMLAGSNMNPIVIVLGNLFVMGFEGFLVGIQVMRLEFYELFGRFYEDGGVAFAPKEIDYTV